MGAVCRRRGPDEIYDVLETPEGQDRAFAKLETIKDHLLFWTEGAQAPQLLADKEVSFTTGYNGRIFNAAEVEGQPFEIIWDGQIVEWDGWVVPAGGKHEEEVLEYLRWATDTQRLADQAKYISYGPARASSAALVDKHADLGIDMKPAYAHRPRELPDADPPEQRLLDGLRRRASGAFRQLDAPVTAGLQYRRGRARRAPAILIHYGDQHMAQADTSAGSAAPVPWDR
jgi:spermidine/putrescine-binding protein